MINDQLIERVVETIQQNCESVIFASKTSKGEARIYIKGVDSDVETLLEMVEETHFQECKSDNSEVADAFEKLLDDLGLLDDLEDDEDGPN